VKYPEQFLFHGASSDATVVLPKTSVHLVINDDPERTLTQQRTPS